ncbi:MAG: MFS transporter [Fibrobacter sp.]|nr:MFS transporter [Fibrobacter sp.]
MASNQYHTLVLEHLHGFSASQIGDAVALGATSQIFLPWLIILAGKWLRNYDQILRRAYFCLAFFLLCFPWVKGYSLAMLNYYGIVFSLSVCAALQGIALIAATKPHGDKWTLIIRSMGTLGYAVSCLISIGIAKYFSYTGLYIVFAIWALLSIPASKMSGAILHTQEKSLSTKESLRKMWSPDIIVLLIVIFIANMSINGATSVLSNFIFTELKATNSQVSLAWTIATFAEIPMIFASIYFLQKFGIKGLILVGIFLSTFRMGAISQINNLHQLYAVQTLHGMFFGASLSGVGIYFGRKFGTKNMQKINLISQSIYGGLAGVIGGKAIGLIWHHQGLRNVYLYAFIALIFASLLGLFAFKESKEIAN